MDADERGCGDWLVNDDTLGGIPQVNPDVAFVAGGRFVVVWEDYRKSDYDSDIYCQCFDSLGRRADTNRILNEDTLTRNPWQDLQQHDPGIASSKTGQALVGWEDLRTGASRIYCQLLGDRTELLGRNRQIGGAPGQHRPDISAAGACYAVVWEQQFDSARTIMGCIVDSLGQPGPVFPVTELNTKTQRHKGDSLRKADISNIKSSMSNIKSACHPERSVAQPQRSEGSRPDEILRCAQNDRERRAQNDKGICVHLCSSVVSSVCARPRFQAVTPAVAGHDDGFLIAWAETNGGNEVRLRRFDTQGNPLEPSRSVVAFGMSPAIACDRTGAGMLVWQELTPAGIWGQAFDSLGDFLGPPFRVNSPDAGGAVPAVAAAPDGSAFFVAWEDFRSDTARVAGRILSVLGQPLSDEFYPDLPASQADQHRPALAVRDRHHFLAAWEDSRENNPDIYGCYQSRRPVCFRANSDHASTLQDYPLVTQDEQGQATVFWFDSRYDARVRQLYGQRLDENLRRTGDNFRVSDAPLECGADFFWAATTSVGKTVIAWQDLRNGNPDIYAQVYDAAGARQGANFRVNDNTSNSYETWPQVSLNDSGKFIVVWSDGRNHVSAPYVQMYDADNRPLGTNWRADWVGREPGSWLGLAGDFWLVWKASIEIRARHYNADQQPLDTALRVNADTCRALASPEILGTDLGSIWFVWMDARRGKWDVFCRRTTATGEFLGPEFRVNDDSIPCDHLLPGLSWDRSDRVYITWTDFRIPGNTDVRAQVFDTSGARIDTNLIISTDPYPNVHQYAYGALAPRPGHILCTWLDNRNRRSFDVMVREGLPSEQPRPWWQTLIATPSVVTSHCLLRSREAIQGHARLQVIDAAGRERINLDFSAGEKPPYFFDLDCRALPSGVFFPVLTAEGRRFTGRFVVLRR
jgi:hypothetical protein